MKEPVAILLLGPPGSGKGTHALPLSRHLGLPHISTGDLFREEMREGTPLGKKAKEFIDKGQLVPDILVLDMLFERLKKADCQNGYILDGVPRTIPQALQLDARLNCRMIALNFRLSDEVILERITGRLACKGCGKPWHKLFDPPERPMRCDACGSELYQRADDTLAVAKKRLEVYRAQTEPLIAHYAAKENVLKTIDSGQDKEKVFKDVLDALSLFIFAEN
jgi:adenylate kinase